MKKIILLIIANCIVAIATAQHVARHYPNSFPLKTNDLQRIVS